MCLSAEIHPDPKIKIEACHPHIAQSCVKMWFPPKATHVTYTQCNTRKYAKSCIPPQLTQEKYSLQQVRNKRPKRGDRCVRCVHCVLCVGWKPGTHPPLQMPRCPASTLKWQYSCRLSSQTCRSSHRSPCWRGQTRQQSQPSLTVRDVLQRGGSFGHLHGYRHVSGRFSCTAATRTVSKQNNLFHRINKIHSDHRYQEVQDTIGA